MKKGGAVLLLRLGLIFPERLTGIGLIRFLKVDAPFVEFPGEELSTTIT